MWLPDYLTGGRNGESTVNDPIQSGPSHRGDAGVPEENSGPGETQPRGDAVRTYERPAHAQDRPNALLVILIVLILMLLIYGAIQVVH